MTNELIFLLSITVYFALLLAVYRFFGKTGLYCWIVFAAIVSSLEVYKVVTMFGMSVTLGNVIYGSSFLATDILSENYGKKEAAAGVNIGLMFSVAWILATQLVLWFVPNSEDFVNPSLVVMFGLVPRITISSVLTYVISQKLDIFLYHFWWKKTGGTKKYLWLRNNGSTLISQLADNIIFTTLAFFGIFDLPMIIELIFTTYVIKVFISVLDTPIIYIARHIKEKADSKV